MDNIKFPCIARGYNSGRYYLRLTRANCALLEGNVGYNGATNFKEHTSISSFLNSEDISHNTLLNLLKYWK